MGTVIYSTNIIVYLLWDTTSNNIYKGFDTFISFVVEKEKIHRMNKKINVINSDSDKWYKIFQIRGFGR
jgi:hypothetical protein